MIMQLYWQLGFHIDTVVLTKETIAYVSHNYELTLNLKQTVKNFFHSVREAEGQAMKEVK